ncbi:MAG: glycosyltransferase [Vicinamibacterales bacterium]
MTESSVSVVVRSFNEERHIGRLLTGLVRQTQRPNQILLVDSGSTDATVEIASRFPVEVHAIEPARFSFGRSLNVGMAAARGEVVVIASAHVYPLYETWIAELVAPLRDPEVALAYGRQVGDERTKYSEGRVMARWFPQGSVARQDHPFCNNANAAVRRASWREHPYDEDLTGLEDVDWAKRQMELGAFISYAASAAVVHSHDETWGQLVNRYRREAIAHRRIYPDHKMSALEAFRLGAANTVSDWIHAGRDGQLIRNLTAIPRFRAAQFWGTYHGFRQRGETSVALRRHFYYPHGLQGSTAERDPSDSKPIEYGETEPRGSDARRD